MRIKNILNVFNEIFKKISDFLLILFNKYDSKNRELPEPLKKYTITAIFPTKDMMEDAMKNLK